MIKTQLLTGLLAATVLAGCSFMPEHTLNPPPVPQAWAPELLRDPDFSAPGAGPTVRAALPAIVARPTLPPVTEDSWRDYFTDPALQQTIAAALANNRDLAASLGRVTEARAQANLASAGLWPGIDLVANRIAQETPTTVTSGVSPQTAGSMTTRFDVNLNTSYEVDFWGRLRSLDTAAQADFLATQYAHQTFRIQLVANVALAWYTLENWQQREHVLKRIERARQESLELIRQRRDVGLANELEVTTARASYHQARGEHYEAIRQRVFAENALRLLLGREIDDAFRPTVIASPALPPVPVFPKVLIELPSEVILRRPDVHAAEERLRAARANIGAARAAFLPHIVINATAGSAASKMADLFSANSGMWIFTPVLRLPIFDGGRHDAELDITKARENIAVANYERTIQQAFREVADAMAARPYGWVVVAEMYNVADAQQERLALVEARHQAGIANYLELLDAQRDALIGEQNRAAARLGIQMSAVAIYKAIGGI